MSYILDALKKSEQERGHGSAPNVQTLHSSSLNYNANKTPLWPYFLLAAIVINLAALFYFIINKTGAEAMVQEQQTAVAMLPATADTAQAAMNKGIAAAAYTSSQADSVVYKPVSMPGTSPVAAMTNIPAATNETRQVQPARGTIVEMDELPFDVRQHIPALEFSAHVYSSNPLQRSIVINGRFMEEGDRLAAELFLSEITPDGAIFDFQGQLFHQGVISAWN